MNSRATANTELRWVCIIDVQCVQVSSCMNRTLKFLCGTYCSYYDPQFRRIYAYLGFLPRGISNRLHRTKSIKKVLAPQMASSPEQAQPTHKFVLALCPVFRWGKFASHDHRFGKSKLVNACAAGAGRRWSAHAHAQQVKVGSRRDPPTQFRYSLWALAQIPSAQQYIYEALSSCQIVKTVL